MKTVLAKRTPRISSRERTQNRRIDQSLMELVNTVATDLAGEDPPPGSHVDVANSRANTTDLQPKGAPEANAFGAAVVPKTGATHVPETVTTNTEAGRKPRERLTKMNVWFTQDDAMLVTKISAARGQKPEDLIQLATLKLLAELGALGEERKRLLIHVRG